MPRFPQVLRNVHVASRDVPQSVYDEVERVTYLRMEFLGPHQVYLVASVDLVGDYAESRIAHTLRALEDRITGGVRGVGAGPGDPLPEAHGTRLLRVEPRRHRRVQGSCGLGEVLEPRDPEHADHARQVGQGLLPRIREQAFGREPNPEEIAEELEITTDEVREILRMAQTPVSLEKPIGEEEDSSLGDFVPGPEVVEALERGLRANLDPRRDSLDDEPGEQSAEAGAVLGQPTLDRRGVDAVACTNGCPVAAGETGEVLQRRQHLLELRAGQRRGLELVLRGQRERRHAAQPNLWL